MTYIPAMEKYKKQVLWHIPHEFTKEMSQKSVFVSIPTIDSATLTYTYLLLSVNAGAPWDNVKE